MTDAKTSSRNGAECLPPLSPEYRGEGRKSAAPLRELIPASVLMSWDSDTAQTRIRFSVRKSMRQNVL